MITESQFDGVVTGFYAAATGELAWEEALLPVHTLFRSRTAIVQSVDLSTGHIVQFSHAGDPMPDAILSYLRHWHEIDPRRSHLLSHAPEMLGQWWHCHDHFDEEFVSKNRFYREFLPAQQTRYLATLLQQPASDTMTALSLELPAERGPLDCDEQHLIARIGRHFSDALRAYERVRRMASQALAGHALLDTFAHPMWLIDTDRVVLHANQAARTVATEERRMGLNGRRMVWKVNGVDRKIGEMLTSLASQVQHGQHAVVDARGSKGDTPSWLHMRVLDPARVLGTAFGNRPMLLITLLDPLQMRELDAFALSEVFGMTPAEGRVAALLSEGLSAQAIGQRLGCRESTVRTHLRHVLHKLGAAKVTEAVSLLRQGQVLWARPAA